MPRTRQTKLINKNIKKFFSLEAKEVKHNSESEEEFSRHEENVVDSDEEVEDKVCNSGDEVQFIGTTIVIKSTDSESSSVVIMEKVKKEENHPLDDSSDESVGKEKESKKKKFKKRKIEVREADEEAEEEEEPEEEEDDVEDEEEEEEDLQDEDDDDEEVVREDEKIDVFKMLGILRVPFKEENMFFPAGLSIDDLPSPSGYFCSNIIQLNEQIAIGPTNQLIKNPYYWNDEKGEWKIRSKGPYEVLSSDHYMGYIDTSRGRLVVCTEKWLMENAAGIENEWELECNDSDISETKSYGWIESKKGWIKWRNEKDKASSVPKLTLQNIINWKNTKKKKKIENLKPPPPSFIRSSDTTMKSSVDTMKKRRAGTSPNFNDPEEWSQSQKSMGSNKSKSKSYKTIHQQQGGQSTSKGVPRMSDCVNPYLKKPAIVSPQKQVDDSTGLLSESQNSSMGSYGKSEARRIPLMAGTARNFATNVSKSTTKKKKKRSPVVVEGEFVQGDFFLIRCRIDGSEEHGFTYHMKTAIEEDWDQFKNDYTLHPVIACLGQNTDEEMVNSLDEEDGYPRELFAVYLHDEHCLRGASENDVRTYLAQIARFLQCHSWRDGQIVPNRNRTVYKVATPCCVTYNPLRKLGNLIKLHEAFQLISQHLGQKITLNALQNQELPSLLKNYFDLPWNTPIHMQYGLSKKRS